jgi:hypothetical protein
MQCGLVELHAAGLLLSLLAVILNWVFARVLIVVVSLSIFFGGLCLLIVLNFVM